MPRFVFVWGLWGLALLIPLVAAVQSPVLAWRQPVYILGGFAGIAGLLLLLVQPILAAGMLPGLSGRMARMAHRATGGLLVAFVVLHVLGLWLTSPPDVVDALLFRSPTPFAVWGVAAMWGLFMTAVLARFRRRLHPTVWRRMHTGLALVIVAGTVVHAVLIEGAMETVTKSLLCVLVLSITLKVVFDLWRRTSRPR
ncbi:ferric reductase-like transmembrane domain-containing protein [uncultured Sulfitobacter sp.]|uniref:ferric reductase-like transmembrane domain-containing protein n=1 Tax=uncultured Sulfitobacter sp. TaxID=191468 RepID=UPI00260EA296|nr:ferric reductase-like transmembrane domain-containing protein [uncultured Sulfitobacter sp.]